MCDQVALRHACLYNPQGITLFSSVHLGPRVPRPFAAASVYGLSLRNEDRLRAVGCGFKGRLVRLLSLGALIGALCRFCRALSSVPGRPFGRPFSVSVLGRPRSSVLFLLGASGVLPGLDVVPSSFLPFTAASATGFPPLLAFPAFPALTPSSSGLPFSSPLVAFAVGSPFSAPSSAPSVVSAAPSPVSPVAPRCFALSNTRPSNQPSPSTQVP